MKKVWFMLAMMVCIFASCSGGGEEPVTPTPKPEVVKSEITIDTGIISNGLSFSAVGGEQSISFTTNESWTLSVASTTSGSAWCTASATNGSKGSASVKFTVTENTSYDNRSVSVTIKSGTATKTFTISQKGVDALLVTTDKYEVSQEGGTISIEVKANIDYKMEISEEAKSWIKESSSRALTAYKHTLNISANEEMEKREGEIHFKSGDKVVTVKVYQAGGAILMLSQNEYNVSDKGDTISVDIKSNFEFGVQMPDVDWIVDEASSRGLSSHTLKYVIKANEGYDSRSAEIVFFDKNSDLKDTLKVVQAQKDAIVISENNISVAKEGGIVEVKVNTNVDFEVQIPSDATWISQTNSRALIEKSIYLQIAENEERENRSVTINITDKDNQLNETIVISQQGNISTVTLKEAGNLKSILGENYLNIEYLKISGPINGDDICYLRQMLAGNEFSNNMIGKLEYLDLSEASIVEGGTWYYEVESGKRYTSNNVIGNLMFSNCVNLEIIILPNSVTYIDNGAFWGCNNLIDVKIGENVKSISHNVFRDCVNLNNIIIPLNVHSLGSGVFEDCKELVKISMPNEIDWIDVSTFSGCTKLTEITLPDSISVINNCLFSGCINLKKIELPEKIVEIKFEPFYGCTNLTEISIGKNVTKIGPNAFGKVPLNKLYSHAIIPPSLERSCFSESIKKTAKLYIPKGSLFDYKRSKWSDYFENIIEMD